MIAAGLVVSGGAARADLYEYTYTGSAFYDGYYNGPSDEFHYFDTEPQGNLAINLITNEIIPPNSSYTLLGSSILVSITFAGDHFPLTFPYMGPAPESGMPLTETLSQSSITTDSLGSINSWNFDIFYRTTSPLSSETVVSCGPSLCNTEDIPFFSGAYAGDYLSESEVDQDSSEAIAITAGTWSGPVDITTVPEPASFAVLGSGMAGLAYARRRKKIA
jgi:hypothetical protein